jgi:hypothetical protein
MATEYFLAFDGYGYFKDGVQPELSRHALISSDYVYTPEGTSIDIPFFTEDDIEILYTVNGTPTTVDLAADFDNTAASAVKYVTFAPNTNNSSYTINVYNNGQTTLLKSINLIPVCEPKFTPIKCQFINRYGVIQTMYFFKKSTEAMEITDARFQKNIISSSASYDTKESQIQRYDVKGMTRLVLNTGFVNEDFNQTIEELLLSEDTWITYEGNVLAAIPTTKQLQYATSVNNKTINYTVQFDFASETINSVR